MGIDRSESIVREAPEIEAYKLGLLQSGKTLTDTALKLPEQQIAGFSGAEQDAFRRAGEAGGIGGYEALAGIGRGTLGSGVGTLGQAVGALGTARGYLGDSSGATRQAGQTLQGSYGTYGGGPSYTAQQFAAGPGYSAQQFGAGPAYSAQQFGAGPAYNSQGFDPASTASFFNPYEDAAVQQALSDIRRQGDIASNQLSASAVQAGAFGGSREGIQRGELERNILEQQGRTAAGMRQAGYESAQQRAMADFLDQQRRTQAESQFGTQVGQQAFEEQQRRAQAESQFGTQVGQQSFEEQQRRAQAESQFGTQVGQQSFEDQQRRAQAQAQFGTTTGQQAFEDQQRRQQAAAQQQQGLASLFGNLATTEGNLAGQYGNIAQAQGNLGAQQLSAAQQAQQQGLAGLQALTTVGGMQRQQQQAALDAAQGNAQRQLFEPYTRLSYLSDIYKGAPSSQSSIGNQVAPAPLAPSVFQQIGGLGTGLLGAAAGAKALGSSGIF